MTHPMSWDIGLMGGELCHLSSSFYVQPLGEGLRGPMSLSDAFRPRQLPWKSLASIVQFYYMWKTTDRYIQQVSAACGQGVLLPDGAQ